MFKSLNQLKYELSLSFNLIKVLHNFIYNIF